MIQIYTGLGKGKTTAALGQAFRALGQGKQVLMIQFIKKDNDLGELKAAKRFKRFEILQFGRGKRLTKGSCNQQDKQLAQEGCLRAQKAIASKKYDLIILDELNVAVNFNLIKAQKMKEILKNTSKAIEIVVTGRGAHPELLKVADLVSEIKEVRHYYKNGIMARRGIEY